MLRTLVNTLETLMTAIAGTALILMMMVVVVDIAGRSLGLWHILSTVEQTTLYMMLLGFLGLARCFRTEGNIVVDVATQGLSEAAVRRIDAVWSVITAVVLIPLAVMSVRDGITLHGYGQRSEVLGISPLVHHAVAGFGLVIAAIVALGLGLRRLRQPATPEDGDGLP
jgi:TRAP-type C4-dicarboxylate transport system permease small subunit